MTEKPEQSKTPLLPSEKAFRLGLPLAPSMTRSERIMHGYATSEDLAWLAEQQRQHEAWKTSPAGQAWIQSQNKQ